MKKLIFVFCLLFAAILAYSQKIINDPNVELRSVGSFTEIDVSGGIDLYISAGTEAVAVSASRSEFRERIKTEVQNGVLKIWYDNKLGVNMNGSRNLKAYVSYKTLKTLEGAGGANILVDGTISGNDLVIRMSGGSDFIGKVEVAKLTIRQSGGSDIRISGRTANLWVDASGGSDFKGYDLLAENCELEASGGCDIKVTANRELSARASGASNIQYKGKPNVKEVKTSGASSVSEVF